MADARWMRAMDCEPCKADGYLHEWLNRGAGGWHMTCAGAVALSVISVGLDRSTRSGRRTGGL